MKLGALILAVAIVFAPYSTGAQQIGKVHRVGFLWDGPPGVAGNAEDGLRRGLRDLGYVEGQTIVIDYRYADNRSERLPTLVAELVQLPVDVILTLGGPATRAAKQGTSSIPIVATSGLLDDLVASLARPGGNLTGISLLQRPAELLGKWLEILKEVSPKAADVGVLYQEGRTAPAFWEEYPRVAATLGLHLHRFPVRRPEDLDAAFAAMRRAGVAAVVVFPDNITIAHRERVAQLAIKHRLPTIHEQRSFVVGGGLMSYGADIVEVWRRAATYVDKILKGAKPSDLPVEQPTKFELVINLKTAKALDLKIPQAILSRADEVIR